MRLPSGRLREGASQRARLAPKKLVDTAQEAYICFDIFEFWGEMMTISQRQKAKKDLAGLLSGELSSFLSSPEQMRGHPVSRQDVLALSQMLAERIIASQAILEKVAEFAPPKEKEWLTTEEAAQKSGLSRPFIAALLDGPLFEGRVMRTPKGHRRVAAKDFELWMEKNHRAAYVPTTLSEARSGPRDDEPAPLVETDDERTQRKSARARSLALARGMGLG